MTFQKMRAVSIYSPDVEASVDWFVRNGLEVAWRLAKHRGDGSVTHRVGLLFPQGRAELVIHDDRLRQFTLIEIEVGDLREAHDALGGDSQVIWLGPPRHLEPDDGAVVRLSDGNLLILRDADRRRDP